MVAANLGSFSFYSLGRLVVLCSVHGNRLAGLLRLLRECLFREDPKFVPNTWEWSEWKSNAERIKGFCLLHHFRRVNVFHLHDDGDEDDDDDDDDGDGG